MPCDQYSYIDTYIEVLSEISNYCMINNVEYFLLGGDLNTDFGRRHSANTIALNQFMIAECLQCCISLHVSSVRHTFTSVFDTHSLIDHFIATENLRDYILSYEQFDSIDNLSDHLAISLQLDCHIESANEVTHEFTASPRWGQVEQQHVDCYKQHLDVYLGCRHRR